MASGKLTARIIRIVADLFCLFLAFLLVIIFKLSNIQPFRRGFFCDDQSLKHPYKDDTITTTALIFGGCAIVGAVILSTELGNFFVHRKSIQDMPTFQLGRINANLFFWNCYKYLGIFGFGAGVSQTFTDVGKYSIGRLRPHFMNVCQPNLTGVDCTTYVDGDVCLGIGASAYQLKNMRLSFPSGHSSFAMYCAFYATLYLHSRMQWKGSVLLKHLVQALVMLAGFYTCLSRISDYKHHWSDVLAGAAVGIITAIAVIFMISDLYVRPLELTIQQQIALKRRKTIGNGRDKFDNDNHHHMAYENEGARELEGVTVNKVDPHV